MWLIKCPNCGADLNVFDEKYKKYIKEYKRNDLYIYSFPCLLCGKEMTMTLKIR